MIKIADSAHHVIVPHLRHILVHVPLEGITADLILDLPVHDPWVEEALNKEQTLSQPPQYRISRFSSQRKPGRADRTSGTRILSRAAYGFCY
jgi:hypothetical protein